MELLKEDESLDIERINSLPLDEPLYYYQKEQKC